MTNRDKVIIVSLGLVALGFYYFSKNSAQVKAEAIDASNPPTGNTPIDWNKTLKKGSQGEEVKILQTALKTLKIDGDFGDKTETRLNAVVGVKEASLNYYNQLLKYKK